MRQKQQIGLGFHERLQLELSNYPVKSVKVDGTVSIQHKRNPYFLVNDIWSISFFEAIPQFQKIIDNYKGMNRNIRFQINSPSVNLEVKYVWYQKLFRDEWSLSSIFIGNATHLRKLTEFLNEKYYVLSSLLDLDIDKAEREWWFWLEQQGHSTQKVKVNRMYGEYINKTAISNFLRNIHSTFFDLTDTREEWEKDRWDVRVLYDKYGIDYNKSKTQYYLDFTKVKKENIREQVKKYY